jgi:hypothetical protein
MIAMLSAAYAGASQAGELTTIFDRQRADFTTRDSASYCSRNSQIKVVDTSVPLDQIFLDNMKSFGVEVIARYYGYTDKNRPPDDSAVSEFQSNKVIRKFEVDLIKKNEMASIVVFQYLSQSESTFANWRIRAPADADRALALADDLGQPKGTTIYFGADGDFVNNYDRACVKQKKGAGNCTKEILEYFSIVSDRVVKQGYVVGVYGSGATCKLLTETKRFATRCWLDFSLMHSNREFGLKSDKTALEQLTEAKSEQQVRTCGRKLDFNKIRSRDFGQFAYN